ncbi:MAG TPA: glycosyltransferase family 4 protein [Thermoplasmata archaeon]|nr:glycosyltransferase family 4 protein [Thermoplasmata archaeon]
METLRFLMVTTFYPPYHLGGDAVHVQYLAQALAARGHEVHVEFSPAAYTFKRGRSDIPIRENGDGVQLHAIPDRGWTQPVAAHLLGRSGSVRRFHAPLVKDLRADVIHYHNVSLLGLDVFDGRFDARTLYTAHDYWVRCPRSDLFKYGRFPCDAPTCVRCALVSGRPPQLWRYGGWRGLQGVDCAIAPSQFMAQAIRGAVGCPVVHIPNFAPDSNGSHVPSAPEDYFLFVGVLENHKGISELVEASAKTQFPLRVVGRGSLHRRLEATARDRPPRIRIEGWVSPDRLHDLYRHAKALVIPSLWPENAPLAAVEALSCGTPLLVSRRGGLEELLHDGATGFSFEPEPDGIAEAVNRFEHASDSSALRLAARRAYEQYHNPEAYLRQYLDVARGTMTDRAPIGEDVPADGMLSEAVP